METKPKACKGINKANGVSGCGKDSKYRTFGLCNDCLSDFLFDTDKGKLLMQSRIIPKAKTKIKSENTIQTRKDKVKLLSTDQYRQKYLQPVVNEIARLIDYQQPCIATGNYGKMAGGHFWSVGSNRTTALNLHNIHIQNFESNGMSGGDPLLYIEGLKKIYGNDYFDFVHRLKQTPVIKLEKNHLERIFIHAKDYRNELKKKLRVLTPKERIEARNAANFTLGIYEGQFAIFEL